MVRRTNKRKNIKKREAKQDTKRQKRIKEKQEKLEEMEKNSYFHYHNKSFVPNYINPYRTINHLRLELEKVWNENMFHRNKNKSRNRENLNLIHKNNKLKNNIKKYKEKYQFAIKTIETMETQKKKIENK